MAGFYSSSGEFTHHLQTRDFCQQRLADIFDGFYARIRKKIVVVLDNAPAHHDKAFDQKAKLWQEQDLYLFYLPAYSPELNKIGIIRRKIKYGWLHFYTNLNFQRLKGGAKRLLR